MKLEHFADGEQSLYASSISREGVKLKVQKPEVVHEGHQIIIRTFETYTAEFVLLNLRNGFPIHSSDRVTPIYALYNSLGMRTGHAIWLPDMGLNLYFDGISPPDRYWFQLSGRTDARIAKASC